MSAHEHSFSYDNDPRPGQRSLCCACGTYMFEHAPGHPYGVQAGPGGLYARWCLVEGCDWRGATAQAGRVEAGELVAFFLACVIGLSLAGLALMGAAQGMCKVYEHRTDGPSYCENGHVR